MTLRSIYVATGSTVVHQFHETEYDKRARFNLNSGPGAFSVSGSFTVGYVHYGAAHTPNTIDKGLLSNGLFQIPEYHGTTDAAALVSLADPTALAAGTYNGTLFYMGAAGYTGANAHAIYYFSRANCLYFCRNGHWHSGWYAPNSEVQATTDDPFSSDEILNYRQGFENAGGWDLTLSINDLSSSSGFTVTDSSEVMSTPVVDVSSFSNWASDSDTTDGLTESFEASLGFFGTEAVPSPTVDFTQGSGLTDGLTEAFEQSAGFLGTEAGINPTVDFTQGSGLTDGLTEAFEQSTGFFGTEQSPSPSPDWADLTTYYEGFEDW